jgi:DMSO/TMAO reductase YedYZ molybdopterin-dependent catalytic subunit
MLDRQITPADVFFERSHHGVPMTCAPLTLDGRILELARFPEVSVTAVLQCAGNGRALFEPRVDGLPWTFGGIGQATWTGIRLADVIAGRSASHVWFAGADDKYRCSLPIKRALHPSTLLATRMNGAPLRREHGAPMRLVVPGWSGNSWMKWVTRITLADAPYVDGAYEIEGEPLGAFPVKSLIAAPADGATLAAGPQEIVGVAFSGAHAIARVDVAIDDTWHTATTDGESAPGRWTVFRLPFDAEPGRHRVVARATDTSATTQPERALWNAGGYHHNAMHSLVISVEH